MHLAFSLNHCWMDPAMRLASLVRRVVIGLSTIVLCVAAIPPVAVGWEGLSPPTAHAPAAGSPARNVGAGVNPAATAKRGPLFHGKELRWPSMPFARKKAANDARAEAPRTASQGLGKNSPRVTAHGSVPTPRWQQRVPSAPSPASGNVQQAQYGAPNHQLPTSRPSDVSPTTTPRTRMASIPSQPRPIPSPAIQSNPTSSAARAAVPASPADRLIIQAHELSTNLSDGAQSEADFSRIIETCRRARGSQPGPATARYAAELASWAFNRRGQLKAEAGRNQEAIRDFDDAIRADPRRWRAIHNRGVLLAQSGEFEKAFDDFDRTIKINPKHAKAYSNRAALFVVAGSLTPALKDYARAIELDPSLAVAHRGSGRACHLVGRLDEAINHYNAAVRLAPDDAYAAASRADLLTDLGRYADARAEYERAIELDPQSSQAYSGSAWLLATCPDNLVRNSGIAIARANKAIELSEEKDAVSFDALAAAQANAGDFSAAIETIRQAVELAPAEEREVYEDRLLLYQHAKPYRIAPVAQVTQASYVAGSHPEGTRQGAGSKKF